VIEVVVEEYIFYGNGSTNVTVVKSVFPSCSGGDGGSNDNNNSEGATGAK